MVHINLKINNPKNMKSPKLYDTENAYIHRRDR